VTHAEQLAAYTVRASYFDLSTEAREKLKSHVLDTIGCAIGAAAGGPIQAIRREQDEFPAPGPCTMIGGGTAIPERAAFYNTALVRYLDFLDCYLAKTETCHPADNFGALIAAAETRDLAGADFLAALAVAYHVQARFTGAAPVMKSGFDHTTQLAYSITAGVSRVLALTAEQTANAMGINGSSALSLAASRTGRLSQWKGLSSAATAQWCLHGVRLAQYGITGPVHIFEGKMGLEEALGKRFRIEWDKESIEGILGCSLKKYEAQIHTQPAIEGIIDMRAQNPIDVRLVTRVEIDTFRAAYDLTGGGEWGERETVETKEQADHSLPWLAAVALIDGQVGPEQFTPERIRSADVQQLMQKVRVRPANDLTRTYPSQMDCKVRILLSNNKKFEIEKKDYEGFFRRPMRWERVVEKFERLAAPYTTPELRSEITSAVANLDGIGVRDLTRLLGCVRQSVP
jgi:2-methylcitrate dehydratase